MDGRRENVGNFIAEGPGLFRGRGEHPKQSLLKKRCLPQDVSLNIGIQAQPPVLPTADNTNTNNNDFGFQYPGHAWGDIYHDNTVAGLGFFEATGERKYIQTAASSFLKMQPDLIKFEKARELGRIINRLRRDYWTKIEKIE